MSQKLGKFLLLAGLIFLAFPLSALAQDLSKRFTASDYFNFEYVSSESEQYYMALKLLGIEAVLVRFPDEPHGIMARPSRKERP